MPKFWRALVLAGTVSLLAAGASPAAAQSGDDGRLFVRGYGGAAFSSVSGADRVDGAVFGGGVGLNLSRHFAVIGDVGYFTNLAREDGEAALKHIVSLITLVSGADNEVSLEARSLYVLGGARFTMGGSGSAFRPFVEGQGGMIRSSYSLKIGNASGSLASDANTIFKSLIGDTTATAPAAGAGGGLDFRLSSALSAELAYHYLRLLGDAKSDVHQITGGVKVSF
jgi:opacity protein-like surface antigen